MSGGGREEKRKNERIAPRLSVWGWYRFSPPTNCRAFPTNFPAFSLPGPAAATLHPQFGFLQLLAPTGRVITQPGMPCPRLLPVPPGSRSCSGREAKFSAGYDDPCGRHTRWTRCPVLRKADHPNSPCARDSRRTEQIVPREREIPVFLPLFSKYPLALFVLSLFSDVQWNLEISITLAMWAVKSQRSVDFIKLQIYGIPNFLVEN